MTEIELQLRLDPDGRTAFDASASIASSTTSDHPTIEKKRKIHDDKDLETVTTRSKSEEENKVNNSDCTDAGGGANAGADANAGAGIDGGLCSGLDYSSKTVSTALSNDSKIPSSCLGDEEKINLLDELSFDCEIADCALLPRTFWLPAKGMKPRCALEQCALEVFHHHVKQGFVYDEERSGCEWWVQIRPSPPAGRYTILCNNNTQKQQDTDTNKDNKTGEYGQPGTTTANDNEASTTKTKKINDDDLEKKGICFHWDKDEDLRLLMGGKMYIHPHISTVSYLSNIGAPTMALNYRVNPLTGEYISPSTTDPVKSYISWPRLGKHLSFDGRYLHAAPYDLMEEGEFERQIDTTQDLQGVVDGSQKRKVERRCRRVTFLVNIWLNYKPFNVDVFPDSMVGKLSKPVDAHILFNNKETNYDSDASVCINNATETGYNIENHRYDGIKPKTMSKCNDDDDLINFQWPLGNCSSERLEMQLPLKCIRRRMEDGGDVCLTYECQSESERAIRLVQESVA